MILAKKALLLEKTLVAIKYNAKQLKKENREATNLYFQILFNCLFELLSTNSFEKKFTEIACNQYIPIGFLLLKALPEI